MNKEAKVLLVCIVLFSTITAAQFVAAFVAHSLTLLADCGAMTADVVTYMLNFYAEVSPNKSHDRARVCYVNSVCLCMCARAYECVCALCLSPSLFFPGVGKTAREHSLRICSRFGGLRGYGLRCGYLHAQLLR